MRYLFLLIITLGLVVPIYAQQQDSITEKPSYRFVHCTYIGAPLVVGGLIEMGQNEKFRSLRNGHLSHFTNHVDNYSQYLPAAVMLGMKAAGVKSKSTLGEMLVADVFSTAMMVGVVNSIKYTAKVERPDESTENSFPSGHTATAFMTATMLTEEYGYLSPWVGIGAYAVATGTGVMRVLNNRHWMSDVMAGAGIGIMSTEFGYWLRDVVFKRRVSHRELVEMWNNYEPTNPSFFGFYAGFQIPLSHYDDGTGQSFFTSTGSTFGLEGAWYWNHNWGIGGRSSISSVYYSDQDVKDKNDDTYQYETLLAGLYTHHSIYKHLYFEGKALVGALHYNRINNDMLTMPSRWGETFSTGVALGVLANKNIDINFYFDYNLLPPHNTASAKHMSTLGLGARMGYRF